MSDILLTIQDALISQLNIIMQKTNKAIDIFTHVPANSKFPYISLGKIELKDRSSKTQNNYDALFSISIYSRERNYKLLFILVDEIKKSFTSDNIVINNYNLFNIACISCEIDQKQDGITSFANLKYKLSLGV